ncbi:hypothetical protein VNO80_06108 [Phaseolus coccineus]|uniref:Uncharacterized protein n=1 Tax=Phaseolus coccineus TaxID=3886 RepID=A0AAN9NGX4_PHACN
MDAVFIYADMPMFTAMSLSANNILPLAANQNWLYAHVYCYRCRICSVVLLVLANLCLGQPHYHWYNRGNFDFVGGSIVSVIPERVMRTARDGADGMMHKAGFKIFHEGNLLIVPTGLMLNKHWEREQLGWLEQFYDSTNGEGLLSCCGLSCTSQHGGTAEGCMAAIMQGMLAKFCRAWKEGSNTSRNNESYVAAADVPSINIKISRDGQSHDQTLPPVAASPDSKRKIYDHKGSKKWMEPTAVAYSISTF